MAKCSYSNIRVSIGAKIFPPKSKGFLLQYTQHTYLIVQFLLSIVFQQHQRKITDNYVFSAWSGGS